MNFYYEALWKHVVRNAAGLGDALRVDGAGERQELHREHLVELFDWVQRKAGGVGEHTLVYHPDFTESINDILDTQHWTGDAGIFDSGNVGGIEGYSGTVRLRPDEALYPECVVLVDLESVGLTGEVQTIDHGVDETTAHPYAVATGVVPPSDGGGESA